MGVHSTQSVSFDGSNDEIVVPPSAALEFTTDFTLACWVKRSDNNDHVLFCYDGGNNHTFDGAYYFYVTNANKLSIVFQNGSDSAAVTSSGSVSSGSWHHVVATHTGGTTKLYIDGSLDTTASQRDPTGYGSADHTSYGLTLGRFHDGNGFTAFDLSGLLDDARAYAAALSDADVANLYAAVNVTSGLVAYWALEEGSGTSAADSTGNGHTGTLTNGPTWSTDVPTPLAGTDYTVSASGGITLGSVASASVSRTWSGSGGVVLGGLATVLHTHAGSTGSGRLSAGQIFCPGLARGQVFTPGVMAGRGGN